MLCPSDVHCIHLKKQATTQVLCLVRNESNAMFIKRLMQELSDDWNWVKLSSPAEMAMTPTPQQETRGEDPAHLQCDTGGEHLKTEIAEACDLPRLM